jgi:hypothetical protein
MKKGLAILILIAFVTIIFSGCTNSTPTSIEKHGNDSLPTSIATYASTNLHKYNVGAKIQRDAKDSAYNKDHAWVVINVSDDGKYNVGQIYYDTEARKWYKVDGEQVTVHNFAAVEREYPVFIDTIEWDTFPVKFNVKGIDGTTRVVWPIQTTPTPSLENTTRVNAEGFFHVTGIDGSHEIITTMNTVEVTNLGTVDAENVQVNMAWWFKDLLLGKKTLYFGTVKVGQPIKKEFAMDLQLTLFQWGQYNQYSNTESIRNTFTSITGDNVITS